MVAWPVPDSIKTLCGFLGLTGFYRKFIRGYASIAAPLTALLRKDSEAAFDNLKKAMTEAPVLALPDFSIPFTPETDAFVILTDHKSLKELMSQVVQTPEQQVYLSKLLGYDYSIQYKSGKHNWVADALSRLPVDAPFYILYFLRVPTLGLFLPVLLHSKWQPYSLT